MARSGGGRSVTAMCAARAGREIRDDVGAAAVAGGSGVSAAERPGLHLSATEDHFVGTSDMQRRAADRAGARIEVLDGLGHWWMVQDPKRGAVALERFWESLPAGPLPGNASSADRLAVQPGAVGCPP